MWIDISIPVKSGMVTWPGDPPVEVHAESLPSPGGAAVVSRMTLSSHTGTHMDAPLHYIAGGAGIDTMPPDATVGPARVIAVEGAAVTAEALAPFAIRREERILIRTRNSTSWQYDRFRTDFVALTVEAARHLAERGVRCVGVDYLSVGGYHDDGAAVHRALLGAGIWIIEGLDLTRVEPGDYDLICLPLRIAGGDGSPARAMVRPREAAAT